jgi:NADH-quinone oxidoreductase subunit J
MTAFTLAAAVAVVATFLAITRLDAVSGLLYLNVSLLAVSVVYLQIGAPFAAVLEILVYAGVIVVLFVFVIMLFDVAHWSTGEERAWLRSGAWAGPAALTFVLAGELYVVLHGGGALPAGGAVGPKAVGRTLFSGYVLGVEMVSLLLLAGLVGAYHIGRRLRSEREGQGS